MSTRAGSTAPPITGIAWSILKPSIRAIWGALRRSACWRRWSRSMPIRTRLMCGARRWVPNGCRSRSLAFARKGRRHGGVLKRLAGVDQRQSHARNPQRGQPPHHRRQARRRLVACPTCQCRNSIARLYHRRCLCFLRGPQQRPHSAGYARRSDLPLAGSVHHRSHRRSTKPRSSGHFSPAASSIPNRAHR